MEYRVQAPPLPQHHHLYSSQSPAVADHHSQTYATPAYTYFPDPNPNPNPNLGPFPRHESYGAGDGVDLRPPGVDACQPDPYAAHGGYAGHVYAEPSVAGMGLSSYYLGAGGGVAQGSSNQRFGGIRKIVGTKRTSENLETKKQKLIQGGTAVGSVRVCSICNVVCNSNKVFLSHLAGEKHLMKTNKGTHPVFSGVKNAAMGMSKVVQSVYCEVCKIDCNSQEVFNNHKLGKKHKKNLQKLQESTMAKPMNTPSSSTKTETPAINNGTAVVEQPKKKGPRSSELDLETKRQKVLEGGAAADAIKVCSLCNVVCNSQTVFDVHIAGQRHMAMVKKQQETQVSQGTN